MEHIQITIVPKSRPVVRIHSLVRPLLIVLKEFYKLEAAFNTRNLSKHMIQEALKPVGLYHTELDHAWIFVESLTRNVHVQRLPVGVKSGPGLDFVHNL